MCRHARGVFFSDSICARMLHWLRAGIPPGGLHCCSPPAWLPPHRRSALLWGEESEPIPRYRSDHVGPAYSFAVLMRRGSWSPLEITVSMYVFVKREEEHTAHEWKCSRSPRDGNRCSTVAFPLLRETCLPNIYIYIYISPLPVLVQQMPDHRLKPFATPTTHQNCVASEPKPTNSHHASEFYEATSNVKRNKIMKKILYIKH